jgi:hypothetical protein
MLELSQIRIDGDTQSRAELNQSVVDEYAEGYRVGVQFPPVVVFFDGSDRWLADGFHRYFGAKAAGLTKIYEEVIPGTQRDAVLYSLKANATHGLKRTNADKRKAVETMLKDAEWATWSDRKIAEVCGVGYSLVSDVRKAICPNRADAAPARTVERNGTTYTQNTANIGKNTSAKAPAPARATNTKPAPVAAPAPAPAYDGPDEAEIRAAEMQEQADQEAFNKLLLADDKLATAYEEIKRLNAVNAALESRLQGLMNEKNEAIRLCKSLQRRLDRAEKEAA